MDVHVRVLTVLYFPEMENSSVYVYVARGFQILKPGGYITSEYCWPNGGADGVSRCVFEPTQSQL